MGKEELRKLQEPLIKQLFNDAESGKISMLLTQDENWSYLYSYKYFIEYFKLTDKLKERDLVIGAHFTYGWMPTIMEFKKISIPSYQANIENYINILNAAKDNRKIESTDISCLKEVINNSMIGASKLLHFVNPSKFAIWDSNVCAFLNKPKNRSWNLNKVADYMDYMELMNKLLENTDLITVLKETMTNETMTNEYLCDVTNLRILELAMFILGRKIKGDNRPGQNEQTN